MRAIGFSEYTDRRKLKDLIKSVVMNADYREYTLNEDNVMLGEFCKNFTEELGISVCGEFDEDDKFSYEYYFPFILGREISTSEDVSVERHSYRESYAGVCDDVNVGLTLIFYLQNMIPYVKEKVCGRLPIGGTSITMSALSVNGTIMMPIKKDEFQKRQVQKNSDNRSKLLAAARQGDEEAIETLTLEDMDMYTTISRKIQKEDVFSIVDTYFMPSGVECDQYSILGEIMECKKVINSITQEEIFIMTICSNELTFDLAINKMDLLGEPQVGRRFKGNIWLQGYINFPDEFA
jgi:hypothetical protein